eukprot:CAMPEP_0173334644 /NCGR_PEP_ID=MMETSP1144-20121109/5544_1 /TAXON_ID=483371 /ORGANISM="non described non described, Strain CCMP2298" /LENGTH=313 /DNA_ID=CAMNT_0014279705 /DNA_START=320 /DNA_END=1262 /DNA_ORIENTATION=-
MSHVSVLKTDVSGLSAAECALLLLAPDVGHFGIHVPHADGLVPRRVRVPQHVPVEARRPLPHLRQAQLLPPSQDPLPTEPACILPRTQVLRYFRRAHANVLPNVHQIIVQELAAPQAGQDVHRAAVQLVLRGHAPRAAEDLVVVLLKALQGPDEGIPQTVLHSHQRHQRQYFGKHIGGGRVCVQLQARTLHLFATEAEQQQPLKLLKPGLRAAPVLPPVLPVLRVAHAESHLVEVVRQVVVLRVAEADKIMAACGEAAAFAVFVEQRARAGGAEAHVDLQQRGSAIGQRGKAQHTYRSRPLHRGALVMDLGGW